MPFSETPKMQALRAVWNVDTAEALDERDRLRGELAAEFDTDFDTLNRILSVAWSPEVA